jgi:hypothetical protein
MLLDDDRTPPVAPLSDDDFGDHEDASGMPETAFEAEHRIVGMLIMHPGLALDLCAVLDPSLFVDPMLRVLYTKLIGTGGLQAEREDLLSWLGSATIRGRSGTAAIGYLHGLGAMTPMEKVEGLVNEIIEVADRRFAAAPDAELNPVGTALQYTSRMGLLMWSERNEFTPEGYDYLVEDTIPEKELTIIMGATQAGKSFLAFHLAMCMARAVPFFGRRILQPVPVIWLAYEGGRGARGRMLAYAKHFELEDSADFMFAALTRPVDLWSKETNVDEVIKECEGVIRSRFAGKRPGAVFIDTHNAATPGASEIDSEAVSRIRDRYKLIIQALGCAVVIIGHTNAMGKHRGNELLVNNVDTVITVTKKTVLKNRIAEQLKDDDRRDIRTVELVKQREGETGHLFDFVLPAIETGIKNKFGKSRTSCVVTKPNWSAQAEAEANAAQRRSPANENRRAGVRVGAGEMHFLQCLFRELGEAGEKAPAKLQLPASTIVVHRTEVGKAYRESIIPEDGKDAASPEAVRKRWERSSRKLQALGVIGFREPYLWWTGKEVQGVPQTQRQQSMFDDGAPPVDEFPEDR